jgi:hypothetical protein
MFPIFRSSATPKGYLATFDKAIKARLLNGLDMRKHSLAAAVVGLNETIALSQPCRCGPLLCPRLHLYHCATAGNLRGGNGLYSPPEDLAIGANPPTKMCRAREVRTDRGGLPIMPSETHIVPVMAGVEQRNTAPILPT